MGAAVREPSYSSAQGVHLGLCPTFSSGLHACGKPDKMMFCRKRSLLILSPPDPLIGAEPVKLSVAHVAEREDLTRPFVNLRPEEAQCLISFQLWKSLSPFLEEALRQKDVRAESPVVCCGD